MAVDVGGTKTLAALFNEDGEIVRQEKIPTNHEFKRFLVETKQLIKRVLEEGEIKVIAIAVPGLVNYENQEVIWFGNMEWRDVDIAGPLHEFFKIPVTIDNDANMGALGEANLGAGQGYHSMLYVTLSTGIGTGVTHNGKIDPVLAKSEGGQMHFRHDGQLMRWEKFASGKAFVERFGKFGSETEEGDPAWKEWAEDVSLGLGGLMAVIQPDVIVIGGSMGEHFEKYHDELHGALQRTRVITTPLPPIKEARDADNAVIYGCFVAAERAV